VLGQADIRPDLNGPGFPVYVIEDDGGVASYSPPWQEFTKMAMSPSHLLLPTALMDRAAIAVAQALYDYDWQDDQTQPARVTVVRYTLTAPPTVLLELGPKPARIWGAIPDEGPAGSSGQWCRLRGFRLSELTQGGPPPTFGGTPCPRWGYNDNFRHDLTCEVPAREERGPVDIEVTLTDSRATLTGGFTYT
jgi:hypothetical protein